VENAVKKEYETMDTDMTSMP